LGRLLQTYLYSLSGADEGSEKSWQLVIVLRVLRSVQSPAHYVGYGTRGACKGELGNVTNIRGKGETIPLHKGLGW